jgi:galactokinase
LLSLSVEPAAIRKLFQEKFNRESLLVRAPGRINFIGEHTDYNDGLVMPAAINKQIFIAIALNGSSQCNLYSPDLHESHSFSLSDLKPGKGWPHYLQGVMHGMKQIGFELKGVDVLVTGNIPLGAGLSSSAALCCGFGKAYSAVLGNELAPLAIAKIGQYAEHNFVGVKCGLMDQYASVFGKKGHALLFDCKALTHEYVPFEYPDIAILLIDTKVKHSLADSAYNNRREACELGAALVMRQYATVRTLRDVTSGMLTELQADFPDEVLMRCRYVVEEMERTRQAAQYLKQHKLEDFGKLLYQTHEGLSKQYEVSCAEADFLVDIAKTNNNVLGARMMGGGFGGCTINLVRKSEISTFKNLVRARYSIQFDHEPEFYDMEIADGVSIV